MTNITAVIVPDSHVYIFFLFTILKLNLPIVTVDNVYDNILFICIHRNVIYMYIYMTRAASSLHL